MTPIELRQKGYYALVKELGQVDTIRFLQDVGWGFGDYTQERQQSLKNVTRSDFWQDIQEIRAKKDLENQ
ncbi:MAG: hypothetical protein F6J94_24720 [Moorea sp. SIO1F2]|uniref:Uncharacterized protein n=1 Tax=Moorena producens (strain JHB) TaxID=1454205 RepID=A0A1D9FYY1_MOOP1|nr:MULTISPECIES: hypothetical protein [Moorena]NEO46144.1 hypothetical protein [Moorena sp. SIO4A3]AOY80592.1 hypothetical protein BJP36_12340 [Moorena producens JHB]NEO40013.1 hypothetical protein [Moorena sp. SIOASIH]NEO82393.1 hypothetical protein [Moorena sp. SIO4G3]NET66448.1 hypothetical protein [Moorena sp. SIO1G6]